MSQSSRSRKRVAFSCVPHKQFHGSTVVFLRFAQRPPPELLDAALRPNPSCMYRRGPGGMGWHLHLEHLRELVERLAALGYHELAHSVTKAANEAYHDPASVPCPSREKRTETANPKDHGRITKVNKLSKNELY